MFGIIIVTLSPQRCALSDASKVRAIKNYTASIASDYKNWYVRCTLAMSMILCTRPKFRSFLRAKSSGNFLHLKLLSRLLYLYMPFIITQLPTLKTEIYHFKYYKYPPGAILHKYSRQSLDDILSFFFVSILIIISRLPAHIFLVSILLRTRAKQCECFFPPLDSGSRNTVSLFFFRHRSNFQKSKTHVT